jgi:hypothetical protein
MHFDFFEIDVEIAQTAFPCFLDGTFVGSRMAQRHSAPQNYPTFCDFYSLSNAFFGHNNHFFTI